VDGKGSCRWHAFGPAWRLSRQPAFLDGRNDPLRASHLHGYMGVPSSAALFNKRGGLLTHINAARKAPVNVAK